MKTKNLFFLLTLFATLSVLAQDSAVVINGVRWATHNVAAPGTFAKNPEDAGLFYQWNSKVGWLATGEVTGWNSSWKGGYTTPSATDTWITANDPSPAGCRVPTDTEIQSLANTTKVSSIWTTQNGVNGQKFTDKTNGNSIFLPASGFRYYDDGPLYGAGSDGYYWGSTAYGASGAYYLYFGSGDAAWGYDGRASGFTVRSVSE